jgi:alpha/beta superfamily hydrolase
MDNPVVRAVAQACLDAGLATLRFNFRGVGASEGSHGGGDGEQDDVRAALDMLENRLGSTPAVAGYSFGAAMAAAVVAAGRPVAGVALVAPPGGTAVPLDGARPALVVAGDHDHVCPPEAVQAWRAAAPPGSVHVVPGADHFFSGGLAGLRAAVTAWARRVAAQR